MNKKKKKILISIIIILVMVSVFFFVFANDDYQANEYALQALESSDYVYVSYDKDVIIFLPTGEIQAGFIFYPGGKVEVEAYAQLMNGLAENGILCILPEMPFNLAILDVDAAEGLKENYLNIEKWYIGGHSLGGSMAAKYANDNEEDFEGIILLASYSTENLKDTNLRVLSILAENDGVLNQDKYNESLINLPQDYLEEIIEGGCHGYFGSYGMQDGDGIPTISNEEQIAETIEIISRFINVTE